MLLSGQRGNVVKRLGVLREFPVLYEFIPVKLTPSQDQLQLTGGERTTDDVTAMDVDQGLVARIFRMEMGRIVVAIKHRNANAEKQADFWHKVPPIICYSIAQQGKKEKGNFEYPQA